MKTTINDVKTWREYQEWRTISMRNNLRDHKLPEEQLKLIDRDGRSMLSIRDLSHDVVRQITIDNGKKLVPGFSVDENNTHAIDSFVMWLRRDPAFLKLSSGYSFRKGLLLRGPIGSGKTLLFKAFIATMSEMKFFAYHFEDRQSYENDDALAYEYGWNKGRNESRITSLSSNAIAEAYSIDGFDIFLSLIDVKAGVKGLLTTALFIDDIGSEPVYSHFGNPANIIGEIIIRRYEKGSLTHGTSNLSVDELKQLYGLRVYDRMREMFNDVIIKGESRR